MYTPPEKQMRFEDSVYELIPDDHFLKQLEKVIDWSFVDKRCRKLYPQMGRPAYPARMVFKLILLQFMYNLSDRALERAARYWIDFRWFAGICGNDPGPDHTAYCRFRDRLGPDVLARMLNDVVSQASEAGLVTDRLSIVDATEVRAKVDVYRWKDDDENPGAKQGPDGDARFGRKSEEKPFFGYKVGTSVDADSEIITGGDVQPGNCSDVEMFADVADEYADAVTADKGFDAPQNYELLHDRDQEAAIIPKRRRRKRKGHIKARYPDDAERARYYRRSKERWKVEPKFNELKNHHGLKQARYWGLGKVRFQVLMTIIAVNVKRIVTMLTGRPRWVTT
jgi:IS5 family transposase